MHAAAHLVGAWQMTRYLLAVCLFLAAPAFAATWKDGGGWKTPPLGANPDGTYTVLPDRSSPNNNHVTTCSTSSCTRTGDVPAPAGRGNPRLLPGATFPKGAVVAGALALGSRALPWLSAGYGLYDWYRSAGLDVSPDGSFTEPSGGTTSASTRWINTSPMGSLPVATVFSSASSVCAAYLVAANEVNAANTDLASFNLSVSLRNLTASSANCRITGPWVTKSGSSGSYNYDVSVSRQSDISSCFDSSGRFVSLPTGGICPGPVLSPITQAQAEAKLNSAPITADVLRKSLEEVLKAGGSLQDTGTHTVTGPVSVPGETKTKTATSANGTTTVSTVNNTYNYSYSGNTFIITTTETITNPDGSTETTASDTPDPLCADNPISLACVKLGDVPTDEPGWETKTIAYQADSLGLPAACPAPWTATIRGWSLSMSYQPACDVAPSIRLGLLALSSLGALLMIITTVRT